MSSDIQLPLDGMPEAPDTQPRFDLDKHRAFGSVPGLVGRNLEIPEFHRLDERAVTRVAPDAIERGLYGRADRYAVDGLVLSPEEYTGIIRNVPAFRSSISAKIAQANRMTNGVRATEKELNGVQAALNNKKLVHENALVGLVNERSNLVQLQEWQRVPGFWRTDELTMRLKGNQAWNYTFRHIVDVLKDQHDLDANEHIDMMHAMAYKLFRGPQKERIEYWGKMLQLGVRYSSSRAALFTQRAHVIDDSIARLDKQLAQFHEKHGV